MSSDLLSNKEVSDVTKAIEQLEVVLELLRPLEAKLSGRANLKLSMIEEVEHMHEESMSPVPQQKEEI